MGNINIHYLHFHTTVLMHQKSHLEHVQAQYWVLRQVRDLGYVIKSQYYFITSCDRWWPEKGNSENWPSWRFFHQTHIELAKFKEYQLCSINCQKAFLCKRLSC